MNNSIVPLTIIIVNYNTRDLLLACLESIETKKHPEWEIIVVDNGSLDSSVSDVKRKFQAVRIIENKENLGFAAANNQAIRVAKGSCVLLLNSDTEVQDNAIEKTLLFLEEHAEYGAVTCRLRLPNGLLDPAGHRGFPTPWAALTYFFGLEKVFPNSVVFGQYHQGYKDFAVTHDIDCPSGAFFLVRRKVIDHVGLLDEDFFMYGEDIDWAYRMKEKRYRIAYYPAATVLHRKKQSGRSSTSSELKLRIQRYFYQTMIQFYKKHYTKRYPAAVSLLIIFFIRLRIKLLELLHI